MVEDSKSSMRDLMIIVGLVILLVGMVIFAESRTRSYQEVIVGSNSAAVVAGQAQEGDGSAKGDGSASAVRYKNTVEFIKMVVLITISFISFIAILTTIIILAIRIFQRRIIKSPEQAGPPRQE
jgi:hypothetical protein